MYNDKIMSLFLNPVNVGDIRSAEGVGVAGNPDMGEQIKLYLSIEKNHITKAKFKAFGSPCIIASASLATQMLTGRPLEEAHLINSEQLIMQLEPIPAHKISCTTVVEEAILDALDNYYKKQEKLAKKNETTKAKTKKEKA